MPLGYNLGAHVMTHTGENHSCNYCGGYSIHRSNIGEHGTIHAGENHSCDRCGGSFSYMGSLLTRMITHTENIQQPSQENHSCNRCFITRVILKYI